MTDEPKELTVEQVATELQVHKKLIYQWIQEKAIPAMDLGSSKKHVYRISRADLDAFKKLRRTVKEDNG